MKDGSYQFHPLADIFPLMEGEEFDALVADIKKNALRFQMTLYEGKILDGRNRYRAMLAAGHTPQRGHFQKYEAAIDSDTPLDYVIRANILRRHLTAEQKREIIAQLIKAGPEKSDRQIGKMAKADHKTVGTVRKAKEATGEISPVEKRVGADGKARKQPAKKSTEGSTCAGERARARREAKRKQKNEERDAKEAAEKAKAEQLATDLLKASLAKRVLAYLTWEAGDPLLLQDALTALLRPNLGNDIDPEESAAKRRAEWAALQDDGLDIPDSLRRERKAVSS